MMASRRSFQAQQDYGFPRPKSGFINTHRSPAFSEVTPPAFDNCFYTRSSTTYSPGPTSHTAPGTHAVHGSSSIRPISIYSNGYTTGASNLSYGATGSIFKPISAQGTSWEHPDTFTPEAYVDEFVVSPNASDYTLDLSYKLMGKSKAELKGHSQQRRPSNRDEFDGPHQFLQRPSPEYIAQQERDLPHLPTNLVVHEQDSILTQVNDRLSQCAFDFVAKYQFPIPLANGEMRPVERPQDREWTEWVYLLKRLATKRRIPARVLYNGQIKQFITILENSLEMRHAAKHQSRPLKDDRNILQLISAGIQVAKILKDASAMDYLDRLYVTTEKRIQERSSTRFRP
ncbi:hypothetical protein GcM3_030017 [Golovinomyces cichoracearum]|uniref:Uncharacterized protein n=1 Tax=Golovinomyces cichoracearum TaxID=62708 RepID=A0A420J517_9PEZI|nr:hypothetical protein GcM3_030017 [Golovinomyces cichoracearum]